MTEDGIDIIITGNCESGACFCSLFRRLSVALCWADSFEHLVPPWVWTLLVFLFLEQGPAKSFSLGTKGN